MQTQTVIILILTAITLHTKAELTRDGYLVIKAGGGDERVVPFEGTKDRIFFERVFLAEAPHTRSLIKAATSQQVKWNLVGYIEGHEVYDLIHEIQAYGGSWGVKTILIASNPGMFRPIFSRETQPAQWPIQSTFFSFARGQLSLVDRYRENAKISGPYGHVATFTADGWLVEDFTKHPELFSNQ